MSGRYTQATADDQQIYGEADRAFVGVDMRTDPVLVAAGYATNAVNMVFRYGCADPRRGFQARPWGHAYGACFPVCTPTCFSKPIGLGKVYGACSFTAPIDQEHVLVATESTSYCLGPGAPPIAIPYPSAITVTEEVHFTQCFDVLIMWRGTRANPLKLEMPVDFTTFGQKWEEVPDETNGDYTATIPDTDMGLYYGNRLWVPFDQDQVAFSDLLAYTRYDPDLSTIYANEGANDTLKTLIAYGQNSIIAFKSKTIMAILDVLPSPLDSARLQIVSNTRGTIAPDSVTQVGDDVWFLSDDGVYALSQAFDNALKPGTVPVSWPMDPFFKRINWACAQYAQGIYHDAKFFLAVPIDSAKFNNAVVVYDFVNNAWSGYWTGPFFDIFRWVRIFVYGQRRLGFVSSDNIPGSEGVLYILGDGYTDEGLGGDESDIATELVTRGYSCEMPGGDKAFLVASAELDTWDGAGTIECLRDGVNERNLLYEFSKDRREYETWAKADYDVSNANDDFLEPYRQDYSVRLIPPADGGLNLGSGIAFNLHQRSSERMRVRKPGFYLQLRLTGTRGRVKVSAVNIGARPDQVPLRKKL